MTSKIRRPLTWAVLRARFEEACAAFDILAEVDGWGGCFAMIPARSLRNEIEDILSRGSENGCGYFGNNPRSMELKIAALRAIVDSEVIRHDRIVGGPKRRGRLDRRLDTAEHPFAPRVKEYMALRAAGAKQ